MTSFFTHGFAIHVKWSGTTGVDQFGQKWECRGGKAYHEHGVYVFELTYEETEKIWLNTPMDTDLDLITPFI